MARERDAVRGTPNTSASAPSPAWRQRRLTPACEFGPELGLHHVHVGGNAMQVGLEVVAAARLGLDAVLHHVMQHGAKATAQPAGNGEPLVDDHAGDARLGRLAEDVAIFCILDEKYLLANLVDPPEEAPELEGGCGGRDGERERELVGVARVGGPDLRGERGQARVEAAADEVRDGG
jgi:hypothetical protein